MHGPSPFRCLVLAGILILAPFSAFSAPSDNSNPKPTAPPISPSTKKIPENPFRCDRQIKYRGKTLSCDSALRRDGEGLRSIMENTPDAMEELELYQQGRNSIKFAAYTGTAGVVLLMTSSLIANIFIDESRQQARQDVTRVLRLSGAAITFGSIVFGLSRLRTNEDHLQQSILKYNAAHADHPIEVLFQKEF